MSENWVGKRGKPGSWWSMVELMLIELEEGREAVRAGCAWYLTGIGPAGLLQWLCPGGPSGRVYLGVCWDFLPLPPPLRVLGPICCAWPWALGSLTAQLCTPHSQSKCVSKLSLDYFSLQCALLLSALARTRKWRSICKRKVVSGK